MPNVRDGWAPLEHGPLTELSENLWWALGTLPRMPLRRAMTIARLADGRLLFHSPVQLAEAEMARIEAWGTPSFLVVPNGYHRSDARAYKRRYPALEVFAPAGSKKKVEEVIAVDGAYEDFPKDAAVSLTTLPGIAELEGALTVRSADGVSVVLNDLVFNMDTRTDFMGYLITTLMGSAPGPRISRLARWALVKDRRAVRAELHRLAELPDLARLVVAHDKVASGREAAAEALRKAATYL